MAKLQVLNEERCFRQGLHGISLEYLISHGQSLVRPEIRSATYHVCQRVSG